MIAARIKLVAALVGGIALLSLVIALAATRADLAESRAQFEQWKTAVAHAKEAADARAHVEKLMKEAEYAKAAETAQMDYSALRDRYAALLRAKAAGGAGGRADLPGAAESAAVPADSADGAGVPLGTILIAQSDALICAENTAYAQAAHGWAMALEPE